MVHILFTTSNSIFRKQSVRLNDFRFVAKMDPKYSAQDVARCDLCKTAIAHSYCDFCHVNLCKPCIGEHISDDYTKHIIVAFQQRRYPPIYPKCEKHPNQICELQCKDCNIFLCTDCLASEQHNNCLLYTSDAADDMQCVDLGGRRIIKK